MDTPEREAIYDWYCQLNTDVKLLKKLVAMAASSQVLEQLAQ